MSNGRKKTKGTGGAWLRGQKREIGLQAREQGELGVLSPKGTVQFRDNELGGRDRAREERRRSHRNVETSDVRSRESEQGDHDSGSRANKEVERRTILTLQQIHDALTREQIEDLYEEHFDPRAKITIITSTKVSKFTEDCMIKIPKKRGPKKQTKRRPKMPSEMFGHYYLNISDRNGVPQGDVDANAVLGCYFVFYKRHFGEEDPEWVGSNCNKAIDAIKIMAVQLCDEDYSQLTEYIMALVPLWAQKLREGDDFPTSRPTFNTLFVSRKIWAQRYSLFKRWNR